MTDTPAEGADAPADARAGGSRSPFEALEHEFARFFARAKGMWRESAAAVHPDLQPVGYKLLALLHRDGPMSAGELAARTETDKSVVSRQLRFLDEHGLVEGVPDPDDGRRRIIAASADASARLDALHREAAERRYSWLGAWPEGRLDLLTELLRDLNDGLHAEAAPGADERPPR